MFTRSSGFVFKTCLYEYSLRWPTKPVWYLSFLNSSFFPVTKGSSMLTITQISPLDTSAICCLWCGEFFPRIAVETLLTILPRGWMWTVVRNSRHWRSGRCGFCIRLHNTCSWAFCPSSDRLSRGYFTECLVGEGGRHPFVLFGLWFCGVNDLGHFGNHFSAYLFVCSEGIAAKWKLIPQQSDDHNLYYNWCPQIFIKCSSFWGERLISAWICWD